MTTAVQKIEGKKRFVHTDDCKSTHITLARTSYACTDTLVGCGVPLFVEKVAAVAVLAAVDDVEEIPTSNLRGNTAASSLVNTSDAC